MKKEFSWDDVDEKDMPPAATDPAFDCLDCERNTCLIDEYYMVHKKLWLLANPKDVGMLCIVCLENRIGRTLSSSDFTEAPINCIEGLWRPHSRLLYSRLTA